MYIDTDRKHRWKELCYHYTAQIIQAVYEENFVKGASYATSLFTLLIEMRTLEGGEEKYKEKRKKE